MSKSVMQKIRKSRRKNARRKVRAFKKILQKTQLNCYLSGRTLTEKNTTVDHIKSLGKGGKNILENCKLADKQINTAKGSLSKEEFLRMCLDVVLHQGFLVIK